MTVSCSSSGETISSSSISVLATGGVEDAGVISAGVVVPVRNVLSGRGVVLSCS